MKKLLYIIPVLLLLVVGAYVAMASSVGPNSCGTGADNSAVGTIAWTNPTNGCGSDTVYATADSIGTGVVNYSHYLKATNFGFSIPSGATINGIYVEIQKKDSTNSLGRYVKDTAVQIVKSDGSIGATNKADTVNNWPTTAAYVAYGGSADLWGETWTTSDINSSNFGVVLQATINDAANTLFAYIDDFRITVYYTTSSGANQVQIRSGNLKVKSGNLRIK